MTTQSADTVGEKTTTRGTDEPVAPPAHPAGSPPEEPLPPETWILRSLLENMSDAIVFARPDGNISLLNSPAERLLGNSRCELLMAETVTICPADQRPWLRALRGESVPAEELIVRTDAGDSSRVMVTAWPLRVEDGSVCGGLALIRDITSSKRATDTLQLTKEAAESANQAKSEFLYRMSLQLRAPLNSILGFAQVLALDLSSQQRESVQHILAGGYHLMEILDEVLDLARVEAGRLSISREPVRTGEALRNALDLVRPLAVQRDVTISQDSSIRCDRHVRADRQRLKQVFLNLLSNAVKFNRSGGSVAISCRETPEHRLRIEISDTGCGMTQDELKTVFAPEPPGITLSSVERKGLGLVLSRHLVQAMGGIIGGESTVGKGSTFFIELPLIEDPLDRLEGDGAAMLALAQNASGRQRGTVLYIEDNPSNFKLIERIFAYHPGVRLLSAMQAQLGLDVARAKLPDWILLDLHLPDMPGEEVLRRLREDPRTCHIPVTVLSADATPQRISRLMAAGARDYLTKPLDVKKILKLLENTMQG